MKKILLLFLSFCLIFTISACQQQPETDTSSETLSANKDVHATSSKDQENNSSDQSKDASDERFTIVDGQKIFEYLGVSVSVPQEWEYEEISGEDGTSLFFSHPELGERCHISVSITGAEYLNESTQEEYLEYLRFLVGEDAQIDSFSKEKFNGYDCTKIVASYSSENTEFTRNEYDDIVVGVRLYNFTIVYPAAESKIFEPTFNSIINSIKFIAD